MGSSVWWWRCKDISLQLTVRPLSRWRSVLPDTYQPSLSQLQLWRLTRLTLIPPVVIDLFSCDDTVQWVTAARVCPAGWHVRRYGRMCLRLQLLLSLLSGLAPSSSDHNFRFSERGEGHILSSVTISRFLVAISSSSTSLFTFLQFNCTQKLFELIKI